MSVAFRRESDEEHKEPRFELPIPPGPNLVTPRGLRLIQDRVTELEATVASGSDPVQLEEAKRDLRYWRTRQATAVIAPAAPDDEVAFGSRVTFRHNGLLRTLDIVGDDEAEPSGGSIAFSAPLARVLIGGFVGDLVDFGRQPGAIEIVAVAPIPSEDEGAP